MCSCAAKSRARFYIGDSMNRSSLRGSVFAICLSFLTLPSLVSAQTAPRAAIAPPKQNSSAEAREAGRGIADAIFSGLAPAARSMNDYTTYNTPLNVTATSVACAMTCTFPAQVINMAANICQQYCDQNHNVFARPICKRKCNAKITEELNAFCTKCREVTRPPTTTTTFRP
jgi:hypothetical protein